MARPSRVKVIIEGEDRASPAARKVQGSIGSLGKSVIAMGAGFLGAAVAVRGLVRAFTGAIRAAIQQEDAVNKLRGATLRFGDASAGMVRELTAQAAALQQVTKFGDETIIAGQSLVASFASSTEEIKLATAAALDLATATGTELNAAFLLLGRAATGETSTLSRYGIILDENIPKSEKFMAAIAAINKQFGGQARAAIETYSGAVAQLGNTLSDLSENVGEGVIENEALVTSIKDFNKAAKDGEGGASRFGKALGFVAVSGIEFFQILGRAVGALKRQTDATDAANKVLDEYIGLMEGAGIATKELTDLQKAQARQAKRIADATSESNDLFEKLGITLETKVNEQLKENAEQVERIEELYRLGIISLKDYNRAQDALATSTQELRADLHGQKEAVESTAEAYDDLGESADDTSAKQRTLRAAINETTAALDAQATQAVVTSRVFDAVDRQLGRSAAVQAALAGGGELTSGGRRIRLPGGGSRLVPRGTLGQDFSNGINLDGTPRRYG